MFTTDKATRAALQALETIYKQAMRTPRYNDTTVPQTSLTGAWELQANNDSTVSQTVVDRKQTSPMEV